MRMNPRVSKVSMALLLILAVGLSLLQATPQALPSVPAPFTGNAQSATSIEWSWGDVIGETGYEVHDATHAVRATANENQPSIVEPGLIPNTLYTRHVHALNLFGASPPSTSASRYTLVPDPTIEDFLPVATSPTQIDVLITPPPNRLAGFTGVAIERSTDGTNFDPLLTLIGLYVYRDMTVLPGRTYHYRILYQNGNAVAGPPSLPRNVATPPAPPPIPTNLAGTALTSTSIRWSWFNVAGAEGFNVHTSEHANLATLGENTLTWDEAGLSPNTRYTRHVHSRNTEGLSDASTAAHVYTRISTPSVGDFSLTVVSGNRVDVAVVPASNPTGGSTGFILERAEQGQSFAVIVQRVGTYAFSDASLRPGRPYDFRIRYVNGSGQPSDPSPLQSITTPGAPPPAPTSLSATTLGVSSIRWTWANVLDEEGYDLHDLSHGFVVGATADQTTLDEGGLPENTKITRHIHSKNMAGLSAASANASRYTWVHVPTTAEFTVTAVSSSQIDVLVAPPPNAFAGSTGVRIERRQLPGGSWTWVYGPSNVYAFSNTGLLASTTYEYHIAFMNGDSVLSAYSDALVATTLGTPGPPAGPGSLSATVPSTTSIQWNWINVAGATGFVLHDPAHTQIESFGPGIFTYTQSGLNENTRYSAHVHAILASGPTQASATASRYTRIRDATTADFTLTAKPGDQVEIAVLPPANPTSGNTGVRIDRRPVGVTTWTTVVNLFGSYFHTDTALEGGTDYEYRMAYVNGENSPSTPSDPVAATTLPSPPKASLSFSGTVQSTSSILWTWSNVLRENSFALHDDAHNTVWTLGQDELTYLESGLGENARVSRHIHAVNTDGASPPTTTFTRHTRAHDPTADDFTVTVVGAGKVEIVALPLPNPNSGSSGFRIERSPTDSNYAFVATVFTAYTYTDTSMPAGGQYWYRIRYQGGDGDQTAGAPGKMVDVPAPLPPTPNFTGGTAQAGGAILWTWSDVSGEDGFRLHDLDHVQKGSTLPNVLTFNEPGLGENEWAVRHVHSIKGATLSGASSSLARYSLVHAATTADFSLAPVSPNRVNVTVIPPPSSTRGSTGVEIERSLDDVTFQVIAVLFGVYNYADLGREGGTAYYYRVRYLNADGLPGAASGSQSVTTSFGPPSSVAGTPQTIDAILWTWPNVGNETGYVLHNNAHDEITSTGFDETTFTEGGLAENTAYPRHVHALEAAGPSAASGTTTVHTLVHQALDTDFTLTATSTQVAINVVPPPGGSSGLTGVEVQRLIGPTWTPAIPFTNAYNLTLTGTPSTSYTFRIRFRNGDGVMNPIHSTPKTVITPGPPPTAPGGFSSQALSMGSIRWQWSAVGTATDYLLHDSAHNLIETLPAGTTNFVEANLTENRAYSRHVHARNAIGTSAASATSTRYTFARQASLSDFQVRVISPTLIRVTVTALPNGADGFSGCEISRFDGQWTIIKPFSPTYFVDDINRNPDTTYAYAVLYRNGNQIMSPPYSPARSATTSVPPAPSGVSGAPQSPNSILWSWNEIGGAYLYRVETDAHVSVAPSGEYLSLLETGLTENEPASRHVHAANGIAWGPASATAVVTTRVREPVPGDLTLRALSTSDILITMRQPPNATAGQTACAIERSSDGMAWGSLRGFLPEYSFTDSGLEPATVYHYRARWRNAQGVETAWSSGIQAITIPQPTITTASKKVRTAAPTIEGSADPTLAVIRVYFNGALDGQTSVTGGAWTYTPTPKAEGTYTVTARAFVDPLESNDSNAITITVDLTPPSPPTNIRVAAYNATVDIEWDRSPSPDVIGYRIYRKLPAEPDTAWMVLNTGGVVVGTMYRDSTVTNGTAYQYRVTAVDDALPN